MRVEWSSEKNFPTQHVMVFLNPRDWWKALNICQICLTKAPQGWGLAASEQNHFLQLRVELTSEKNFSTHHILVFVTRAIFCLDLPPGHLFAFPYCGIFESQELIENHWLSPKFSWPRLLQRLGLAPLEQSPLLKTCLMKSFGANSIPENVPGIEFWKEFSNTAHPGIGYPSNVWLDFSPRTSLLPLIWYFWILGIDWKPLALVKIYPDQSSSKVWALLLWSKFHSCKSVRDRVLRRNF